MEVSVVEPPQPFVSWAEIKIHAKIEEDSEQAYVEGLIEAATAWLDGPAGWLGRSLGVQVLEVTACQWPDLRRLPFPAVLEIISASYFDVDGQLQEADISSIANGDDLPIVRGRAGDVRIRYRSGYGSKTSEDPVVWTNSVPAPIRVAVMMLVSQWYENREGIAVGASVEKLPFAVDALVQPFRVYR